MKLKPYHSILIFAVLVMSAAFSSVSNYRHAQYAIIQDMDQALLQTLQERQDRWITPDTIESYRSHLRIDLLKETSILSYVLDDKRKARKGNFYEDSKNGKGGFLQEADSRNRTASNGQLNSRQMLLGKHSVQGYANVSMADVFGMSNQRTPLSLTLTAMAWAIFAVYYHRRKQEEIVGIASSKIASNGSEAIASFGSLSYSATDDCFYNKEGEEAIKFTPMQHQLMQMFFENERHSLTKQEICAALWPKKPDASETLYTLIRRIKPIVESQSNLMIESERGRAYRLVVR